ncbi:FadR/GntR family transcriptional regulator [Homoserinibacter sp. GY 40078]|uniref:FadR/GntR family transcriptional regulator n=1 Tax=Homoserinibacter sp. GY 40078 TaxID=2603275 RepID=UPI0011CC8FE6|nr:FadR/GntR family transcriptional regulator [Homoserinibacter sp. GY 40078]TXK19422.1 FadR family transcriptional regulator [Homoserinibacter sp. GY 40078]
MPAYPQDESMAISAALDRLPSGSPVSAVATRLLELFTSGSIAPGTRLPPERQLAASLDVGRSAVREALAALEVLGVVDVRPGSGTYLRSSTSELLPQSLSWGILIGQRSTTELIEVRGALEIYAARLAAERMDADSAAELDTHLQRMAETLDDLPAFVEADLQFHLVLARATGNSVLLDLLQIIRSLLRVWVDRAVEDVDHARAALAEHTAVRDAIAAGDGDAAASAMASHMLTAGRRLANVQQA